MKLFALFTALFLGTITSASTALAVTAESPDIVQITSNLVFAAGSDTYSYAPILTVPSNKRLVVQTISYWRSRPPAGSISNLFILTNAFGVSSYIPGPSITADGSPFPNAAESATFYAGAATTLYVGAYRTGDLTNEETMVVTLSGYYVLKD